MAHHPFPARLRIPTQNVGTGGIRGFQQTDRVASFHSFERRGHPRLFCSKESESLPHGTSRRQGQTHLARRSDRHRDTPCPTGTEHRHLPENRMHYPLLHTFYIRSEAERQAPPPPRSAPVFFVPSACPCGSPRPQTPLTAPALRQGPLRLSARGTVPDGSAARVSESAAAPPRTAARPPRPKRSAIRWNR